MYLAGSRTTNWSIGGHVKRSTGGPYKKSGTASTEGKQDYFEGKVLENSDDYIVIKINSSYEKLISKLGENVKIEKKAVVKECDFSKFISNESVRVLYSGINSKKHELEHIFTIYTLSEIQEIVPSR